MKTTTKAFLEKALPIFQKRATWAVIIAVPVALLKIKAETANYLTDLLSLASTIAGAVLP